MKVKELIKELEKYNPEAAVILQKDSEGNGYSPLSDLGSGVYVAETTWYGEFYAGLAAAEEGENAVVLAPIN